MIKCAFLMVELVGINLYSAVSLSRGAYHGIYNVHHQFPGSSDYGRRESVLHRIEKGKVAQTPPLWQGWRHRKVASSIRSFGKRGRDICVTD